jgi:hypothetical protein
MHFPVSKVLPYDTIRNFLIQECNFTELGNNIDDILSLPFKKRTFLPVFYLFFKLPNDFVQNSGINAT